jgi:glutamyl/glutaminyl-tRNA synthetase
VDDIHFGVDLVVRGEDLLESTVAQLYLSTKLQPNNFAETAFYHHKLMHDSEGEKLSKSVGATSIQYLRGQGHKPSDIYTLLAKMLSIPEPVANWQAFEPWVILP